MPLCIAAYPAPEFYRIPQPSVWREKHYLRELAEYPLVIKNPSRFESVFGAEDTK